MGENNTTLAVARLGEGIYTIPDTSRILSLPHSKVHRWVSGYTRVADGSDTHHATGVIDDGFWGDGRSRGLNFYALIELFTFATLRDLGVSSQKIRKARAELSTRFGTKFPFASHRLLSDGKQIIVVLGTLEERVLMFLGAQGQMALREIVEPFCRKIDFSQETSLAQRFWPLGRNRSVVVDPRHAFGRPTISNTNIPTESIYQFIKAGESPRSVAHEYEISESAVADAVEFELKVA